MRLSVLAGEALAVDTDGRLWAKLDGAWTGPLEAFELERWGSDPHKVKLKRVRGERPLRLVQVRAA